MIGSIIALKFIGKKTWVESLFFWLVYLGANALLGGIIINNYPSSSIFLLLLSAVIFVSLAHHWFRFGWETAFKMFIVAIMIDLAISFVLIGTFSFEGLLF